MRKHARSIAAAAFAAALLAAAGAGQASAAAPAAAPPAPIVGPGGYEMTTYYVGFLFRGPAWTAESTPETQAIQEKHLANIQRLAGEGKLLLAGPFTDNGDLRGMFVFTVGSLEEARALADTDPAVKAGRLRIELHPWYSAKGIHVEPPHAAGAPK